jgi:hypothetical protein
VPALPDDALFSLELGLYRRGSGERLLTDSAPFDRVILADGLLFD